VVGVGAGNRLQAALAGVLRCRMAVYDGLINSHPRNVMNEKF
jgi:hypothetical protein